MKKSIIFLSAVIMMLCAVSCKKDNGEGNSVSIIGEWYLVENSSLESGNLPEVYINFKEDGNFELYQKTGDMIRYEKYTGTYTQTGTSVSGQYSDGVFWGGDKRKGITYTISKESSLLVMTPDNGSGEVCKYEKASLEQSEKDNALTKSRCSQSGMSRFL